MENGRHVFDEYPNEGESSTGIGEAGHLKSEIPGLRNQIQGTMYTWPTLTITAISDMSDLTLHVSMEEIGCSVYSVLYMEIIV